MKQSSIAEVEENPDDWWMRGRQAIVSELLKKVDKKSQIIDIGAGVGYVAKSLRELGFRNILVADRSQKALSLLKEKGFQTAEVNLPEVSISQKFDVALLLDVLEHVGQDEKTLKNIKKLLKQDGQLIITAPAFKFLWSKKDDIVWHKRRYTSSELREKLEKAGYKINYLSYYNFFLFPAAFIFSRLNKNNIKVKRYSKWSDSLFYLPFSSERFFVKSGFKFPYGVSLIAVVGPK